VSARPFWELDGSRPLKYPVWAVNPFPHDSVQVCAEWVVRLLQNRERNNGVTRDGAQEEVHFVSNLRGLRVEFILGESLDFPPAPGAVDFGVVVADEQPVGGGGNESEHGRMLGRDRALEAFLYAAVHAADCRKRCVASYHVGGRAKGIVVVHGDVLPDTVNGRADSFKRVQEVVA
jgi:hypothetical protein